MAQKVLTWSNSEIKESMQFSGLMFINSSWNMYSSQNSLQVSKM